MDSFQNPNPNTPHLDNLDPLVEFELSDYLKLDDEFEDNSSYQSMVAPELAASEGLNRDVNGAKSRNYTINERKTWVKKSKLEVTNRVAFITKSELEVMDDGFKWRKYGKKAVKDSPNPRNYYKCSSEGCYVKKRVERDRNDRRYVITTYEGVHNHQSPCAAYYKQMPSLAPNRD